MIGLVPFSVFRFVCSSGKLSARRFREAADICAQRFKAIDYVAIRGGQWQHAQFQEFLTPENRGSRSTPADLMIVMEERRQAH